MADELRETPLTARHEAAGARLADFAGWRMPIQFEGTLEEHRAVRDDVGVFDVSHLGSVWIQGNGAEDTVAATFTNDPGQLANGESQYTLCCRDDGGIVDDLILYRLASNRYLAVPNAANTGVVLEALRRSAGSHGAEVDDVSEDFAVVAVQGPRSLDVASAVVDAAIGQLSYMTHTVVEVAGEEAIVCRTGYTGERGCELIVPAGAAPRVWDELVGAGATPCGLGARDTLRLEMGYPLHGNDISPDTNPYEARLGWAVKLDRGVFRGQEALRALSEEPPSRSLRGLQGTGRRPPRKGMAVQEGGEVTSGSFSPTLEVGIGLAYLDASIGPGDRVHVDVRGTAVAFDVVDPPFVDRSPRE